MPTKVIALLALMLGFTCLSGCTHTPEKSDSTESQETGIDEVDSLETFNRVMYKFNYGLDMLVLKPVTTGYDAVVPKPGRVMVTNFLDNLHAPVVFANSVLQGDPQNSFATLWRFILNSTFGLGGTIDFATSAGLKNRPADFGETLAMYGMDSGPYIVLPLFGSSTGRDTVGRMADAGMDPLSYTGYLEVTIPRASMTAVDARSRNGKLLDDVYENSIDPYETFRSAYMQHRASDIRRAEQDREKALEQMCGKQ